MFVVCWYEYDIGGFGEVIGDFGDVFVCCDVGV